MGSLTLPVDLLAPDGTPVGRIEMGAAEGAQYPTLQLFNGDIINVRNVQGGVLTSETDDINLDIGAGSATNRGQIVMNWDVGNGVLIYNGRKALSASFNSNGNGLNGSYMPTYFYQGAYVPATGGGWRKL